MFDQLSLDMAQVYPALVVSTMSSGKSTLINALVGTELLPSQNRACTARAVAILDNDKRQQFVIHAVDKNGNYTFLEKATRKIVDKFNRTNDVTEMIIEGEIVGIKNNKKALLLIDTPGINNSMDPSHGMETRDVLEEYSEGLILYIMNAGQLGTYDDSAFLSFIARRLKESPGFNILFAVNKMDLLDASREDPYEIIENCRSYIESRGIENPVLIPVSAESALIFKKVLSGTNLSEMEEEEFIRNYKHFKCSGYSLTDFAMVPSRGDLRGILSVDGRQYTRAQVYAALENTGVPFLENQINELLVRCSKVKAPEITAKEVQNGQVEECKTEDIKNNFNSAINSDFRIVIIAPMSSGKSTLINAILGRDLLPAGNQATTAVITEIRDNDQLEDFIVNATDKYGNKVVQNAKATRKLISELNDKKDPKDPEALIHRIQLEGPIPNIPSDMLNTVFLDTPGENHSQNIKHQAMMDEMINDKNKSLILYVFNGAHLKKNDSNIILQKIADAMKSSTNRRQSRERFFFVANCMDDVDVSEESYEYVIEETILPHLEANGITEPNLFLVSAQTAKLIRKVEHGEELSGSEEEDLDKLVKRFNRKTRILPRYASLNIENKEKLIAAAERYKEAGETAESIEEQIKNKYRAAEINSGIPALELAIKEYLEKYVTATKITGLLKALIKSKKKITEITAKEVQER